MNKMRNVRMMLFFLMEFSPYDVNLKSSSVQIDEIASYVNIFNFNSILRLFSILIHNKLTPITKFEKFIVFNKLELFTMKFNLIYVFIII